MDIQFFHRLTALSLVVHSYFWITFHKSSSWTLQILFGLTWIVQAYFSASGLIVDPSVLYQAQNTEFHDLNANLQQIFSLAIGQPMCMFLFVSNTDLCNQHMQGVKAFRSVIFDSNPITGKCLIRFHLLPWKSSNFIHLFRYLKASYGSFRIVVRPNTMAANFGSKLFLKYFFQVYEIGSDSYSLQKFVDQTEHVPVVVFDHDFDMVSVASALKMPVQDLQEGIPSESCALHRYVVKEYEHDSWHNFIADLGSFAPPEKFSQWQMEWLPQIAQRTKQLSFEYSQFKEKDNSKCAQSRMDFPKALVCPVETKCQD